MDLDSLPPQLRPLLHLIARALRSREPAIRERVYRLRLEHPGARPEELAWRLVRATRRRVTAGGAASSVAAIAPGLGTLVALGTVTGQGLYALEQEVELVLAIAMLYGHELAGSDERLLEALVVVGIAGGSVKLRENLLVAGGRRVTVAAFRRLPHHFMGQAGAGVTASVLGRVMAGRTAASVFRVAPLAIGMVAGAGFDWAAVTVLGRAAIRYYGPGGPAARPAPSGAAEDGRDVVGGG